ncbi:hypothetical protein [Sutcliffiella rhizosphaerae]|uniref:Uncharacterized protein n=1 Tax=Sutcliffiella rhizosphaerae TaxID=2880967 RepID=A0ABN8AC66_9BACI|nr:hypothetical protein [Sutcliffiella rhizosphaerae]CAG9622801.1 hypothetical protein BACCIP111883_03592 [Sutcliffiella rhizosphaerae]
MKILNTIIHFLIEFAKIGAATVRTLQKDDPLTIETDGKRKKVVVPKSIVLGFFIFLSYAVLILHK